jgi:hypothetical protein
MRQLVLKLAAVVFTVAEGLVTVPAAEDWNFRSLTRTIQGLPARYSELFGGDDRSSNMQHNSTRACLPIVPVSPASTAKYGLWEMKHSGRVP